MTAHIYSIYFIPKKKKKQIFSIIPSLRTSRSYNITDSSRLSYQYFTWNLENINKKRGKKSLRKTSNLESNNSGNNIDMNEMHLMYSSM